MVGNPKIVWETGNYITLAYKCIQAMYGMHTTVGSILISQL